MKKLKVFLLLLMAMFLVNVVNVKAFDIDPEGAIYTIDFDSNGGSFVESQRVLRYDTVTEPKAPTRDVCLKFTGWYTDRNLTKKYDFSTQVTRGFTLYAGWGECTGERPVPTSDPVYPVGTIYTITFDSNGGTSVESQSVLKGNTVSKPADPTHSKCMEFKGWYTDKNTTNKYDFNTPVKSSFTLYAGWGECTGERPVPTSDPVYPVGTLYTITFNSNGGSKVASQKVLRGNNVIIPIDPTHSKCAEFTGWYTDSNLKNKYDFSKEVTSSFTLYAGWGQCTGNVDVYYTVTFNSNGGSKVASQKVYMGGNATQPVDPVRDKYVFDGWYSDKDLKNKFNFQLTSIRSNITLYAKWNALGYNPVTYTVSFNSNGGSNVPAQKVLENNYAVKPNDPVKSGYEFYGWYTDSSLTTRFNFQTKLINSNITLYAKWIVAGQVPVYTVDFSYTSTESIYSQSVNSGDYVSKPTDPVRAGYEFDGWYKDENYTQPYDFDNDTIGADTTIYAKWNQKSLLAEIFTVQNMILAIPVVLIFGIGICTVVSMVSKKKNIM